MSEALLKKSPSTASSCNGKVVYGGLLLTALAGALVLYSTSSSSSSSSSNGYNHNDHSGNMDDHHHHGLINRIIEGGSVNVKHLSSMKQEWLHYNDVSLQMEVLSAYMMEGTLVQETAQTTFQVNAIDKTLSLRRTTTANGLSESFYSSKSMLSEEEMYQFTDKQEKVSDGVEALESYLSSDLVSDTYMISLKLAQFGLTGKSSPVVKGFYSIAQTLAKREAQTLKQDATATPRFTQEMAELVKEINVKIAEESSKSQKESMLWAKGNLLDEKLMIGPCGRFKDCTCEIENKTECGNPCYGLCGRNCDCWAFVCGDCNCHCFCHEHDYYCSCVSKADIHCWGIWLWFDACC